MAQSDDVIIHSSPVRMKKCFYTGHATTIYSVEHAISILDRIGRMMNSDDTLPFALRLVEAGELVQIADDNGEFGCGPILDNSLLKLDGYNVLVAVSCRTVGCLSSDMLQCRKMPCIREAAVKAIQKLSQHLMPPEQGLEPGDAMAHESQAASMLAEESERISNMNNIDLGSGRIKPKKAPSGAISHPKKKVSGAVRESKTLPFP